MADIVTQTETPEETPISQYDELGYIYEITEDETQITLTFNPSVYSWLIPAGYNICKSVISEIQITENIVFKYDGINYQYIFTGLPTATPKYITFM